MPRSDDERQQMLVLWGESNAIKGIVRVAGRAVNSVRSIVRDADREPPTEYELAAADRLLRTIARTPHLRARLKHLVD